MLACNHAAPVAGCRECARALDEAERGLADASSTCGCSASGRCLEHALATPHDDAARAALPALSARLIRGESVLAASLVAPPAPVVPSLGRVALGTPADAAALAVIRGLLADERIRRSIEHDAREWSAAVEGHEYRAAQQPEGSQARAAQDERAREARQHRDLYRAVLALHVPSVAHEESVGEGEREAQRVAAPTPIRRVGR